MQRKEKKYFTNRAGIEPVIGHLKAGHRLSRNFYKGIFGDNINVMLAAAGFNFKRMMNKWKASFLSYLERTVLLIKLYFVHHFYEKIIEYKSKWAF